MGAALVLDTAAAMPDRRKFSLNPSFALDLFVFAMVGYYVTRGLMVLECCSCCYFCSIPAWISVKYDQMMKPENMENAYSWLGRPC